MDLIKAIKALEKNLHAHERAVKQAHREWEKRKGGTARQRSINEFIQGRDPNEPPMFPDVQGFIFSQVAPHLHDYTFGGHRGLDAVFAWAATLPPLRGITTVGVLVGPDKRNDWGVRETHAQNEYEYVRELWVANQAAYPGDWAGRQEYGWTEEEGLAAFLIFRNVDRAKKEADFVKHSPQQARRGKRRGVRGLGAVDKNTLAHWSEEPFREPDVYDGNDTAIWYGPDGPDGENATVVSLHHNGATVEEYTYVVGLIEEPDADYTVQRTHISAEDLWEALSPHGVTEEFEFRDRAAIKTVLRWAASLGVAKLAYHGGEESWADALPR